MKVSSHTADWLLPYSPHGHEANSVQQAPDNLCPAEPWRMTPWKAFGRAWAAQRKPRGLLPVGWSLVQLSTTPLWSCRALSLSQCFFFSVLFIVELLDNIFIHFCLIWSLTTAEADNTLQTPPGEKQTNVWGIDKPWGFGLELFQSQKMKFYTSHSVCRRDTEVSSHCHK